MDVCRNFCRGGGGSSPKKAPTIEKNVANGPQYNKTIFLEREGGGDRLLLSPPAGAHGLVKTQCNNFIHIGFTISFLFSVLALMCMPNYR